MSGADWFTVALMVQYRIAAAAYAWAGQWWKAMYWAGALVLTFPVFFAMKG